MEPTTRSLTDLAGQIVAAREQMLADRASAVQRVYLTRSSNIPECARQGVYSIIAYDKRKPFDTHLIARFEEGDRQETWVMQALTNLGQMLNFRVVESQSTFPKEFVDKYHLTGTIDGKIAFDGRRVPVEVKSMNPNLFDNIKMVSDLIADPFYSRYYRQMQSYMAANNETECLLITTNCLGHWNFMVVPFCQADFDEMVVKKVEVINDYAKRNEGKAQEQWELPDRILYNEDHCAKCPFVHICVPDVTSGARVRFADDERMSALLDRREEIKPYADEFKSLDEAVKDDLKKLQEPMLVVGDWIIKGKPQKGRESIVPPTDPVKLKEFNDAKKVVESYKVAGDKSWRFEFQRQVGESVKTQPTAPVDQTAAPNAAPAMQDAHQLLVNAGQSSTPHAAPKPPTPLGWSELDAVYPVPTQRKTEEVKSSPPVPQDASPVSIEPALGDCQSPAAATIAKELGLTLKPTPRPKIRID